MDIKSQLSALENQTAQNHAARSTGERRVAIRVAHTLEEMMQAIAVRAAVFLGEQNCPYLEEFDGNDFAGTHILGLIGDEPAAAMRIRYFADFAKLERMAVRREFRDRMIASDVIEFAFEVCRKKGYQKLHGHAEAYLIPFWEKFGFSVVNASEFEHCGHRFLEIERNLQPHPDPISFSHRPNILIRPEGAWDNSSPLEDKHVAPDLAPPSNRQEGEEWVRESVLHANGSVPSETDQREVLISG